jgi:hypothetical protein
MKSRRHWLAAFGVLVALAAPATASANEVTKWNQIASSTVFAQPGITSAAPAAAVFMAMVQGSVYGAVNAIDRHGRPYLVMARVDAMASKEAAVATAAYRILDTLFPAQHATLLTEYTNSLAAITGNADLKQEGIDAGEAAAAAMLAEGHDGRHVIACAFDPLSAPGVWQPLLAADGVTPLCDPSPWVANAVPFLVKSSSQFRTPGPYALDSADYAADVNEVKEIGALNSATRTAQQTHAAVFWQSNPSAGWNGLARRLVDSRGLDVSDSAKLFAMMDLTAADAIINCWNDKYYWNFWRPIAAIRRAGEDGNPATTADPTWRPLFDPSLPFSTVPVTPVPVGGIGPALITPPYPDHPSGNICFTSSSLHALEAFFGTDEVTFFVTSSRFPGEQRTFNSFSAVINEMIEARIWAGIHFRYPDVQAEEVGRAVARWTTTHYFEPLH